MPGGSVVPLTSAPPAVPPAWYLACQFWILLVFTLALLAVWRVGEPEEPGATKSRRHPAVLWVALALGVWAISSGLLPRVSADFRPHARYLASTLNSAFFLFAVSHFEHGPDVFKRLQESWWRRVVIFVAAFVALVTIVTPLPTAPVADVVLSEFTIILLAVVFFRSFLRRGFVLLAVGSLLPMSVLLALQALELPWLEGQRRLLGENHWVASLTAKVTMLGMFVALMWTSLLVRFRAPLSRDAELWLLGQDAKGHWNVRLKLRGQTHDRQLRQTSYVLLRELVRARKTGGNDGWVCIKAIHGTYTTIGRLRKDLQKGIDGEHESVIANNRREHYRLVIAPDNIHSE